MYIVRLACNKSIVYGQRLNGSYGFDCEEVVTAKEFNTLQDAQKQMNLLYLDELQLGHDILDYHDLSILWEVCYILSVYSNGAVTDHVKYYLQEDGSLAPELTSHNSKKFTHYSDALSHVYELGILSSCYNITRTTEDF